MINLPFLSKQKDNKQENQTVSKQAQEIAKGTSSVKDLIAPESIEIDFSDVKINDTYYRTLFIAGYPRFVNANWLSPLINFNHSLSISMFIYPVEGKGVIEDLRRKIAEMEAEIQGDIQRGRIINIDTQVKLEDARVLQKQLAKGAERFFQFGLYVTIEEDNKDRLDQITKQVKSTLGSLMIIAKTATLQIEDAFKTTLPAGSDQLKINRNMDTTSLATTFPFTSSELSANEGVMYGINEHNDSLVVFDRFTLENANMTIFAKSGAGKSIHRSSNFLIKKGKKISLEQAGPYIDKLMEDRKTTQIDKEIEGVIDPNIKVLTFDENNKVSWAPVTIAARKDFNKRRKLYKATTQSGREIIITADHNLVALRKGKVRVIRSEAIKEGEAIPLSRTIPEPPSPRKEIRPSKYLNSWPNILPEKIPLNNNFLYLLGLITAEGHIKPGHLSVYNFNSTILNKVRSICNNIGFSCHNLRISKKNKKIKGIRITPKPIPRLIMSLGAGGRAGEKRVPPLVFSVKNSQTSKYLQAYFDGDGCVEEHEITCTSKSKELISDLSYLLLRFDIISRITEKTKTATNSKQHEGDSYWELRISGKKHILSFANNINFLHPKKKKTLAQLVQDLKKVNSNTNVDTIPTLQPLYKHLYKSLFKGAQSPGQDFTDVKSNKFNPSRNKLKQHIKLCRERIEEIKKERDTIHKIASLPSIDSLIKKGSKKDLNTQLWGNLGQTWRVFKNKSSKPLTSTALQVHATVSGEQITTKEIIRLTQETCDTVGFSLNQYFPNLARTNTNQHTDVDYQYLRNAGKKLMKEYRSIQLKLRHAENILKKLEKLANSDLFWDPITSIKEVEHQEKYVYDLQVKNGVFLAGHGGMFVHNSYMVKLELLRSILFDTDAIVIDPEDEYHKLCKSLGGSYIDFSLDSPSKINPFDLPQLEEPDPNQLAHKIISLHSLMKVIMGELSPHEEAILDRALIATYRMKGITRNPETYSNEPPLMEDLYKVLIGMEDEASRSLADRIERFIKGSFRGVFDEHSNINFGEKLTVFGIKNISDELRPIAIFIILDHIWTKVKNKLKKRMLIVDEAWYLMQHPDSASFLYSIAKRARKYYLGLSTITQDVEDFLSTEHGKAIVTNSSLQILMKQSPAAIDTIADTFYLSQGERHFLLSSEIGEGLFFAGQNHVAIKVVASPEEHKLITTNPQEVVAQKHPTKPKPNNS